MAKMRKDWPLAFLSLMSIRGFAGIVQGDWLEAVWIAWLGWLAYLLPVKENND